jgi:hypothetical protein
MPTPIPSSNSASQNAMADLLCTIMVLCRGCDNRGKPCWAYMCIKPSMAKSFKEAREKGAFNLEEYGSVIEHGEGSEPPEDVKKIMERDYGMNHNYEDDLLRVVEEIKRKENV